MTRNTYNQGGRMLGGEGRRSPQEKKIVPTSVGFTSAIVAALDELPQVKCGEWSRSYLISQIILNWLRIEADYNDADLELIRKGHVVE
jgi:hypothetical protein